MLRLMWHGTSGTDPSVIALGENGLDSRFAKAGAHGYGTYFANNAAYSMTSYKYTKPDGTLQLLLCLVIVGNTVVLGGDGNRKQPPNRPDGKPYDSVSSSADGNHVIVYDLNKQFPCYLVSFK